MIRVVFVVIGYVSLLTSLSGKPNILLIVTDDQGYSDMGVTGRTYDAKTPNIDRLANSGVRFENGYATSGVCSPSRCALITGVYQERQGNYWFGGPGIPNKNYPTLAEKFKDAGYATAYIGKSHYGQGDKDTTSRNFPNNHGFDYFYGFTHSRKHYLKHDDALEAEEQAKLKTAGNGGNSINPSGFWKNKKRVKAEGFSTEIFGKEALGFMEKHKDGPFFVQLSFNAVHTFTHQLPEEYLKKKGLKGYHDFDPLTEDYLSWNAAAKRPHNPEGRALYLGQLHYLDLEVGKILDFLDSNNLTDNTVIAFISDNGGSPVNYANNDPLREGKFSLYEGGTRVPFLLSWPGHFTKGKVSNNLVSMLDVFPTLCSAAGVSYGFTDGIDLGPLLTGQNPNLQHDVLVWDMKAETAVVKGKWKLKTANDLRSARRQFLDVKYGEYLYNLEEDPGEQRDLRYFFPEKFEELKTIHKNWKIEMEKSAEDLF
jgi:arylsulfatase A-like enzyme